MEFVLVANAMIVGLAIAEILRGFADLFRAEHVRINYRLLMIAGWTLLLLLQVWWSIWRVGENATWTFLQFVIFLFPVAILYVIARLCFPERLAEADLHAHYQRVEGVIFVLVAATYTTFALLMQPFVFGSIIPWVFASQLVLAALALLASRLRVPSFQVFVISAMFSQVAWRGWAQVIGG